ncbi:MAG: M4 family metallopeptidase [Holophagaceae bacterium]|nr:M4 family metallopeptidase [Holophagaceae bacterium]
MRTSLALRLIASAGIASALCAQEAARQASPISGHAQQYLQARVFDLGLDTSHDFATRRVNQDELGGDHIRVDQYYQGVRVFGGEAIVHMQDGAVREVTDALIRGINRNPTPSIGAQEALAAAHLSLAPSGAYAAAPTAELVFAQIEREIPVRQMSVDSERTRTVTRMALVYHVHAELENGAAETSHTDYFVDAHSGEILESWSTLHTAGATGSGNSQFSGNVALATNNTGTGYELYDTTRGAGVRTYNLNHATSGTGTLYTDADNTWGDGANYVEGSSTTAANGQTAGVDAHYGVAVTWDMYKNVFLRNGIDNTGKATYSRVHYSNNYDNAFWSDTCFCMTYGDGSSFLTLTALDVAGHEMTHGVTSREANLTYRGESGGLNESMSDIFGTMAEFYRGSTGSTIPATGGNWTIGEQLATPAFNHPLRYMYKPSLDGASKDAWSKTLKNLDVHYSSGPMNRCFYFLSQGTGTGNYASSYLPGGMTGIGNDKAAKIVYRALRDYMTSSTTYAGAKTACLSAATSLGYASGSPEYTAVVNAFKAINR